VRALRATSALSFAACALALCSCGGSSDGPAPAPGAFDLNAPQVQRLKCRDWKAADPAGRSAMLKALRAVTRGQITGKGASGRGSVLSDDRAYSLFDNYCREHFARAFSLYKLYGQASGFAGD
jgi:hypothetical protein